MFNAHIFILFMIYILSLFIGFNVSRTAKKKLNKEKYKHYKWLLFGMIYTIFASTTVLFYKVSLVQSLFFPIMVLNILYIVYFTLFAFRETRCWKQHRMILYNFFLIPLIFASALIMYNGDINYIIYFIYAYSILEFQFAKFSFKHSLIWD